MEGTLYEHMDVRVGGAGVGIVSMRVRRLSEIT